MENLNDLNEEFSKKIEALCRHFSQAKEFESLKIAAVNENGLKISYHTNKSQSFIDVPFLKKSSNFKDAINALYESVEESNKMAKVEESLNEFVNNQKSVIISSFDEACVSSYAPFVRVEDEIFILISSVARHYHSLKANPTKASIIFLQDESLANTVFARVRASFEVIANFDIKNGSDEKEAIFKEFKKKFKDDPAIKFISKMRDFHLVKFELKKGRFVKGFGAAYDTDGFKVSTAAQVKNPHDYQK